MVMHAEKWPLKNGAGKCLAFHPDLCYDIRKALIHSSMFLFRKGISAFLITFRKISMLLFPINIAERFPNRNKE